MPYATAEQKAERDELVLGLLASAAGGLTEYEVTRLLRARLGLPGQASNVLGKTALRRLEAAGRARHEVRPWKCPGGVRRVWFPAGEVDHGR